MAGRIVLCPSSHNYDLTTPGAYVSALDSFVTAFRAVYPNTPIVVMSQNPKKSPESDARIAAHAARNAVLPAYAKERGFGYIPVAEAFAARPDGGLSLVRTDGIHPTRGSFATVGIASGAEVWAKAVEAYFASLIAPISPRLSPAVTRNRTSTGTLSDDAQVTIPVVESGKTYDFEAELFFSFAGASGASLELGFTPPPGTTLGDWHLADGKAQLIGNTLTLPIADGSSLIGVTVKGSFTAGSTGSFALRRRVTGTTTTAQLKSRSSVLTVRERVVTS